MGLSLGNPLAGKGSSGLCALLLEEEGWAPARGRGPQHKLAFRGAGRYPSLCEKELEGSHMQGFGMAEE